MNSTRRPFCTRASPSTAARCDLPAGRAKEQNIGTLIEPAVASGKRHDLRLADHGHGVEVEGVERFARRQLGASEMPLDAAATAIGDLVFGECREKAGGWPTLLVRTYGQIGPHQLHGRQAQLGEQQLDAYSVGGIGPWPFASFRGSHKNRSLSGAERTG